PDAGHVFLPWLAAALAGQDPPVTLVLDDLHLMTDPKVLDGLDYVLRNVGPGLRLVVSGRMVPLPLHRYRLAGDLTEIRAGDLAFTTAEAGLLLARHGITLTADSLERLTRRTEGWAAGLRPAAISLRRGSPPSPPSSSSSDVMYPASVTFMSVPPHRAPGGAGAGGDRQLFRPGSARSERMRSSNPGRGPGSSMSSAPAAGDDPSLARARGCRPRGSRAGRPGSQARHRRRADGDRDPAVQEAGQAETAEKAPQMADGHRQHDAVVRHRARPAHPALGARRGRRHRHRRGEALLLAELP